MGSRIMHAIIANRIADRLCIEDKSAFILGNIAPDAVTTKNESHFFIGEHHDHSRSLDFKGFLNKYSSKADDLYVLGYYTHLIADDVWLKGFYLGWLRNSMEANKEFYNIYHGDFRLLNGKLLEHYGMKDELRKCLHNIPAVSDLEEVRSLDLEEFVPHALGDTEYKEEVIYKKLNVFTLNQIVGYIETSVDLGVLHLKQAAIVHKIPWARKWLAEHV